MKTVKILLATLILVISLPYSGKSQTISIDREKISFDSAAAVNLWEDIEVREFIIKLYQDELEQRDSALNVTTTKLYATNDTLQYMKGKYHIEIKEAKKEKRTWEWLAYGLAVLCVILGIR